MLNRRLLACCFFFLCSTFTAHAATDACKNNWALPSSQTMRIDSDISFSLTDYRNGERHFTILQAPDKTVDAYYLKGALLIKGYSKTEIEQMPGNTLYMMPMTFFVPIAVLSEVSPKGPCGVEGRLPIAIKLDGTVGLQDRKFIGAQGLLQTSATSQFSYELEMSVDHPWKDKNSVHYSGAMSFADRDDAPSDDIDLTDFVIVRGTRPLLTAGTAGLPAKLGGIKRYLVETK